MTKGERLAFRVSASLKARLAAAAKKVKLNESQLAEACVEALVEYIEEHGEITSPLMVVPKSKMPGKVKLAEAGLEKKTSLSNRSDRPALFRDQPQDPPDNPRLNEVAPQGHGATKIPDAPHQPTQSPKTPITKTRAAIRKMVAREKKS